MCRVQILHVCILKFIERMMVLCANWLEFIKRAAFITWNVLHSKLTAFILKVDNVDGIFLSELYILWLVNGKCEKPELFSFLKITFNLGKIPFFCLLDKESHPRYAKRPEIKIPAHCKKCIKLSFLSYEAHPVRSNFSPGYTSRIKIF